jgi:hypothetical protein
MRLMRRNLFTLDFLAMVAGIRQARFPQQLVQGHESRPLTAGLRR